MKVIFYFPNNNTIEREFFIDTFNYNQVYYNELEPADNSCQLSVPFDITLANTLKINNNENIKAEIKNDDNTNLITGYIRKTVDYEKGQKNKPISLEIVNPSYLLKVDLTEPIVLRNQAVNTIVLALLEIAGFYGTDIREITPTDTVSIFRAEEKEEIYGIIKQLLFEYGYTFDFDNDGKFITLPLFNQPTGDITQIFDGGNCHVSIKQTTNEEKYTSIYSTWDLIEFYPNTLIHENIEGQDVAHKFCNILVDGGKYFADSEWVWLELDSDAGNIIDVQNIDSSKLIGDSQLIIKCEKEGARVRVSIYNPETLGHYITRFQIYADAYINKGTSITKAINGNKILELDILYLNSENKISLLNQKIQNYYRYADFTISLNSLIDYPYGSFVKVSDYGLGTIIGRIISKNYRLREPIEYEIEAISEFVPAPPSTTEYTINNYVNTNVDRDPPTAPIITDYSVNTSVGSVTISFQTSTDLDSGVAKYFVYRKFTSDSNYKVIYQLDHTFSGGEITFVDDSAKLYNSYNYQISAVDNSGNESVKSNEIMVETTLDERPFAPIGVNAYADNSDFIRIIIRPYVEAIQEAPDDKYIASSFIVHLSRDNGGTWEVLPEAFGEQFAYYYNRTVDGFPEKTDLEKYRIRVWSKSKYNNISSAFKETTVNSNSYLTWIPEVPTTTGRASNRQISISWEAQKIYGDIVYEVQIAKQLETDNTNTITDRTNPANWKAPSIDDGLIYTVGTNFQALLNSGQESLIGYQYHYGDLKESYKTVAKEFEEITECYFSMSVPLDQIVASGYSIINGVRTLILDSYAIDTTYYLKVRRRNKTTNIVSNYSTDKVLMGTATSARDIHTNEIKAAHLEIGSVTEIKIDDLAVTNRALAAGAVTYDKILAGTIISENIAANAITTNQINIAAFDGTVLEKNNLGVIKLKDGAITAHYISVDSLTSISANLGYITNGEIHKDNNNYWDLENNTFHIGDGTNTYLTYSSATGLELKGKIYNNANNFWDLVNGEFKVGDGGENILHYSTATGLEIKASKIEFTALGTTVKGTFKVLDDTNGDTKGKNIITADDINNKVIIGDSGYGVNTETNGVITSSNDTESTSVITGSIVTAGGVGIAKNLSVGGSISTNTFSTGTLTANSITTPLLNLSFPTSYTTTAVTFTNNLATLDPGWYSVTVKGADGNYGTYVNSGGGGGASAFVVPTLGIEIVAYGGNGGTASGGPAFSSRTGGSVTINFYVSYSTFAKQYVGSGGVNTTAGGSGYYPGKAVTDTGTGGVGPRGVPGGNNVNDVVNNALTSTPTTGSVTLSKLV